MRELFRVRVEATVSCPIHDSFRVRQVGGMFDVPLENESSGTFEIELPDEDEDWQIGLIAGPSGSGKSTIARKAYGDALHTATSWPDDRAAIDGFPAHHGIKEITHVLTAVGFGSPPAWIRPYAALSRGEQFRCDLAAALLTDGPLVAFDEFTSVVDRTVARFASAAVSKAIRCGRIEKRFVAVTCHYDIARWLEPDWTADMATRTLRRRRLRRPRIELAVFRCHHAAWRLFSPHHYLSRSVNRAAHCYLVTWNDTPVAFCAVLAVPGNKGCWRISRLVVLPDYQGLGIGRRIADTIARLYGEASRRMTIVTSHPAMIQSLKRSDHWKAIRVKKTGHAVQRGAKTGVLTGYIRSASQGRCVVSFRYAGAAA